VPPRLINLVSKQQQVAIETSLTGYVKLSVLLFEQLNGQKPELAQKEATYVL